MSSSNRDSKKKQDAAKDDLLKDLDAIDAGTYIPTQEEKESSRKLFGFFEGPIEETKGLNRWRKDYEAERKQIEKLSPNDQPIAMLRLATLYGVANDVASLLQKNNFKADDLHGCLNSGLRESDSSDRSASAPLSSKSLTDRFRIVEMLLNAGAASRKEELPDLQRKFHAAAASPIMQKFNIPDYDKLFETHFKVAPKNKPR